MSQRDRCVVGGKQENYLNHRPMMARDDSQRLRLMAKAADLISQGDVLNRAVRQRQNWSLSPAAVVIGSVAPAAFMRGNRETFGLYPGEMNFPRLWPAVVTLAHARCGEPSTCLHSCERYSSQQLIRFVDLLL